MFLIKKCRSLWHKVKVKVKVIVIVKVNVIVNVAFGQLRLSLTLRLPSALAAGEQFLFFSVFSVLFCNEKSASVREQQKSNVK